MPRSARDTGVSGEALARRYLEGRGLRFRAANVRSPFGEIDLVMEDPRSGEVVFIEVKTRRGAAFGQPEEAITAKKHAKLRQLVNWYDQRAREKRPVRLDVVGIAFGDGPKPTITHTPYVE